MIIRHQELYNYTEYRRGYVITKVEQLLCDNRNTKLSIKHIFRDCCSDCEAPRQKTKKAPLYDQRQTDKKYT